MKFIKSIADRFRGTGMPVNPVPGAATGKNTAWDRFTTLAANLAIAEGIAGSDTAAAEMAEITRRLTEAQPAPALGDSSGSNPGNKFQGSGISGNMNDAIFLFFARQSFIGWQAAALAMQSPLMYKAIAMPARDATRNGWVLTLRGFTGSDAERADIVEYIKDHDEELNILSSIQDYIIKGRTFGVRHAIPVLGLSDRDLGNPFNIDAIQPGDYRGIHQIDPYWMAPLTDQINIGSPLNTDFYNPSYWQVGGKRVHRSHFCIYRHTRLPDILKPVYYWGGTPLPQMLMERLYAADRTANEAPQLAQTKRMLAWKTDVMAVINDQARFMQQMAVWAKYRDNYGIKVINGHGSEGDSITQLETSLTDLDAVIMTEYQLVAAIAEVPATRFLGTTPKGFNSTGDGEARDYRQMQESLQRNDIRPLLRRHYDMLLRSHVRPRFNLAENVTIQFDFRSPDSPTAKETAEIALLQAQTDAVLVQTGAIDGDNVRQRLASEDGGGYAGLDVDTDPDIQAEGIKTEW